MPQCQRWSGATTTGDVEYSPIEMAFHLELQGNFRRPMLFQLLNQTPYLPRSLAVAGAATIAFKDLCLGVLNKWSTTGTSVLCSSMRNETLERLINYGVSLSMMDHMGRSLAFQMIDLSVGCKRLKLLADHGLALLTFQSDGTTLLEYAARAKSGIDVLLLLLKVYSVEHINRCNSYRLTFFHFLVINYSFAEIKLILEMNSTKIRFSDLVYNGLVTFIKNVESSRGAQGRLAIIPMIRAYGYMVDSDELLQLSEASPLVALEVIIDDGLPVDTSLSAKILLGCLCREEGPTRKKVVNFMQANRLNCQEYFKPGEVIAKYLQTQHKNPEQLNRFLKTLSQCGWIASFEDALLLITKNHLQTLLSAAELDTVILNKGASLIMVYMIKLLTETELRPETSELKQHISKIASRSLGNVWAQAVAVSELGPLPTAYCFEGLPSITIMGSFLACIEMARFSEEWITEKDVGDIMCWFYDQGYATLQSDIRMALRIRHCPGIISFLLIKPTIPNLEIEANLLRELRFIDNNCATIRALTPFLSFNDALDYNAASVTLSWMGRDLKRYEDVMIYFIKQSNCDKEHLIEISANFMVAIDMFEASMVLLAESKAPGKLRLLLPSSFSNMTSKLLLFYYINCVSYGKWRGAPPPLSLLTAVKLRETAKHNINIVDCAFPKEICSALDSSCMRKLQVSTKMESVLQDMIEWSN
ncbi:hypothetical protein HDE_06221 [Halotydeus destructor]|nr:hypothetical protein HDE_06221 [Halotydeus destructor]